LSERSRTRPGDPNAAPAGQRASGDPLAPEVRAFLLEHVVSVARLEILMLLHDDGDALSAGAIARRLGVDLAWASGELAGLAGRGLLERCGVGSSPAYRFAPRSPELRHAVAEVLGAYRTRRVAVIDAIATKPSAHIVGFADAFRLRTD